MKRYNKHDVIGLIWLILGTILCFYIMSFKTSTSFVFGFIAVFYNMIFVMFYVMYKGKFGQS